LKTKHREFAVAPHLIDILPKLVWHFDEPFAVSSAFATYFLARMAREDVTVALTGDGGDEVFAGYPFRYSQDARFQRIAWIPEPIRRLLFGAVEQMPVGGPLAMREFLQWAKKGAGFFTHDADHAFFRTLSFFTEAQKRLLIHDKDRFTHARPSFDILDEHSRRRIDQDPVSRRLYADIKTTLADEMLTKVDRMTMASSLEARVPLLDHRVVEFAASIPARYKLHGRDGKRILKRSARSYLPAEILHRRKHGFNVPLDKWLRSDLYPFMTDLLSEETLKRRGLFDVQSVRRLITDHRDRRANNVGQLYILMNFELWQRQFLDVPAAGVPA
jgi:asparagine synthase (glutamine-hydrolysing)